MPPQQRPAILSETIPVLVTAAIPGLNGASAALQTEFNKLPLNSLIKASDGTGDWYLRGGTGLYGASTDNRMVKIPTTGGGSGSAFVVTDANNASVVDVVTLDHETTGTPTAGIGTGLGYYVESLAGSTLSGRVSTVLTDVTSAAEVASMVFSVRGDNGSGTFALRDAMALSYAASGVVLSGGISATIPFTIVTPGGVAAAGGALNIRTGIGSGGNASGAILIQPGTPGTTGTGGAVLVQGGIGGATSGAGGPAIFRGGAATNAAQSGGKVSLIGGGGLTSGSGGDAEVLAGATGVGGTAGNANVRPGLSGTAASSGKIRLRDAADSATMFGVEPVGSAYTLTAQNTAVAAAAPTPITANTVMGQVAFNNNAAAFVIDNALVGPTSNVFITVISVTAGSWLLTTVCTAGHINITLNTASASGLTVAFLVINPAS